MPSIGPDDLTMATAALSANQITDKAQENLAKQIDNQTDMQTELTDGREARSDINAKQASLAKRASEMRKVPKDLKTERPVTLRPIAKVKASAEEFSKNNPDLKPATLVSVRDLIKGKSKDEILVILKKYFPDITNTYQVLQFLLENVDEGDASTRTALEEIKSTYDTPESQRQIKAGLNIMEEAFEASKKGLGTSQSLKDLYRDITGTHREPYDIFKELSQKYKFEDLEKVIKFLFKAFGDDLRKEPSIERAKLQNLITETKTLQAIRHVYLFFKKTEPRMDSQIRSLTNTHSALSGGPMVAKPSQLTFENMAKQFMTLAEERYPSADKVLQAAAKLGVQSIEEKIIVISVFRDAVREVAVNKIYRSIQHRDDLFNAIIEALEELEDQLDNALSKEEEEEEIRFPRDENKIDR